VPLRFTKSPKGKLFKPPYMDVKQIGANADNKQLETRLLDGCWKR